jgi:hypothetical protein
VNSQLSPLKHGDLDFERDKTAIYCLSDVMLNDYSDIHYHDHDHSES